MKKEIIKNTSYKKQYDKFGVLTNPITKENPYLHNRIGYYRGNGLYPKWETLINKYFKGKQIV